MRSVALVNGDRNAMTAGLLEADAVVFGLGVTGLACVRHLVREGRTVAVVDTREHPPGLDHLRREHPTVGARLGPVEGEALHGVRQIIVSPGVPLDHPALLEATATGAEIVGDIELFARRATAPVIAITGSNGKSTVVTMVACILRGAGVDVRVGGNLGTPALDLLGDDEPGCYVLELSSFQLESTDTLAAEVACILNISPDHLDRHGSLEAYAAAKARVLKGARYAVLNADDPTVCSFQPASECAYFTHADPAGNQYGLRSDCQGTWLARGVVKVLPTSDLQVEAVHDLLNALAAMAISDFMQVPRADQARALRAFTSLPHRCRQIAERNGVVWYDDSKGTNVGAACAAVTGIFADRSGVLIAGGRGKGADFSALAEALAGRVHNVVLIGEDADLIAAAVEHVVPVQIAGTMMDAVMHAADAARPGDAVLLSPACASFDMFENFEARGDAYIACVEQLDRIWRKQ